MAVFKAVVFDLDGTLIDSNWLHLQSWRTALKNLGLDVPDQLVVDRLGLKTIDIAKELVTSFDEQTVRRLVEAKTRLFEDAWRREVKTRGGALEILRMMRARGVRSAVVSSNSVERIVRTIKHFGMETLLNALVGVDEVEAAKPDPALVTAAAKKLGVASEDSVYVGDSRYDVEAGRAAGMRTVLVVQPIAAQSRLEAQPDYKVKNLLELRRIIWPNDNRQEG